MIYRITYSDDYKRVIPAVIIDGRGLSAATATLSGYEMKAYTDAKVNKVTPNTIPYKIETDNGNLAGYFILMIDYNGIPVLVDYLFRPAFVQFSSEISQIINNFITSGNWQFDTLI